MFDLFLIDLLSGGEQQRVLIAHALGGKREINGQGIFNLMVIAHRLCPIIAAMGPLRLPDGRDLPEPDINWCVEDLD
jgi:hypothetical protein